MVRRKDPILHGYDDLDSSDSDSSENEIEFPNTDPHEDDEFTTGHRTKRRRTGRNSKEAAALGVFGSESEDERPGRGTWKNKPLRNRSVGFVKPGEEGAKDEEEEDYEEDYEKDVGDEDENEDDGKIKGFAGLRNDWRAAKAKEGEMDEEEDTGRPMGLGAGGPGMESMFNMGSAETGEDEPEGRPRLSLGGRYFSKFHKAGGASTGNSGTSTPRSFNAHIGLGFNAVSASSSTASTPLPEAQMFVPSLGRGFISSASMEASRMPTLNPDLPEEPAPVVRPSFTQTAPIKGKGRDGGNGSSQPQINQNSFAARMMAKMGYVSGQGLGKSGEGILTPIEVKVRPQGVGVGAIKEKTEQAKAEARRAAALRGEVLSESEDEKTKKTRQRKKDVSAGTTPGTTPRIKKEKTKYRTADEISASAKGLEIPSTLKNIIDFTGKEKKLLTSTEGLMKVAPSVEDESMKIAKMARKDLEKFAGEWKSLQDRKLYLDKEEKRLSAEIDSQTAEINKMQGMVDVVKGLQDLSLEHTTGSQKAIEAVVSQLELLQFEYKNEVDTHDLAEVAVAALHPLFREELSNWSPLTDPFHFFEHFRRLRQILHIKSKEEIEAEYAQNGYIDRSKTTTPYESMIYSLWLPKVRSAINNEWDIHKPTPVLELLDVWSSILPVFIHANVLSQLVLPKLRSAVSEWNPRVSKRKRSPPPPHIWVFQWLPHLGVHMEELLRDVRRKFGVVLDTWDLSKGTIEGLDAWKEVFGPGELESVLIRHLLPRLALRLRTDFEVNPADQQLESLEDVFKWLPFFKISTFGQLFEAEFFPKWLNVLHLWLTHEPVFTEVQEWYLFWQDVFPEDLRSSHIIRNSFNKGLDMMNSALDLGDKAATHLPPPVAGPAAPIKPEKATTKSKPKVVEEPTTFRDVVEDWCAEHNMLLIPLRKAHEASGIPLFRITASASGSGGVVVYFRGDVIWAQDKKKRDVFEPVGLRQLLERLEGRG